LNVFCGQWRVDEFLCLAAESGESDESQEAAKHKKSQEAKNNQKAMKAGPDNLDALSAQKITRPHPLREAGGLVFMLCPQSRDSLPERGGGQT
jgi:hypothetical protein